MQQNNGYKPLFRIDLRISQKAWDDYRKEDGEDTFGLLSQISPDGKSIVFAKSRTYRLKTVRDKGKVLLSAEECREFLEEGKPFLFDLYKITFNEGKGGTPEPLEGASNNGMSNFFAKYSPDGRWIVFCKAKSYMLLQPDSELYIIPAEGG